MEQWALHNRGQIVADEIDAGTAQCGNDVDAINAWKVTTGSSNNRIAILDTGVSDFNVPDLTGKIIYGDLNMSGGHGTEVAALAAARGDDEGQIAGMDWNARIVTYDVSGRTSAQIAAMVNASAGARTARVINCSWGIRPAVPTFHLAYAMRTCRTQ
jgi:hypothetical protein